MDRLECLIGNVHLTVKDNTYGKSKFTIGDVVRTVTWAIETSDEDQAGWPPERKTNTCSNIGERRVALRKRRMQKLKAFIQNKTPLGKRYGYSGD